MSTTSDKEGDELSRPIRTANGGGGEGRGNRIMVMRGDNRRKMFDKLVGIKK
jgi:hypothetical protein